MRGSVLGLPLWLILAVCVVPPIAYSLSRAAGVPVELILPTAVAMEVVFLTQTVQQALRRAEVRRHFGFALWELHQELSQHLESLDRRMALVRQGVNSEPSLDALRTWASSVDTFPVDARHPTCDRRPGSHARRDHLRRRRGEARRDQPSRDRGLRPMEAKPRRRRDAFDRAPSGLVDPRRSDPLNDPLNPRSKRTDRSRYATKTFARVTRPTLCYTCDGHCTRTSLDPRRSCSGQSRPLRGLSFASPRADVACWSVDRTTRRRTPSSAGNPSPARESKGSTER